ncbi:MAG: hypothetical protein FWD22_05510, partial [Treponema sp.]|nr:hypothetical protein [Treponema sp.]
ISTLMQADKILVLRNGTVEAIGSHKELMEQKGTYYRIFEMQSDHLICPDLNGQVETNNQIKWSDKEE